jgi:uncharacterized protein (TIGR04255 family)
LTLSLPTPDASLLKRAPLELVVCQLSFAPVPQVSEQPTVLAVHEALGGAGGQYPRLEQTQNQTAQVQVASSAFQVETNLLQGWRLRSENGDWTVVLMPDHVALGTTAYTTWTNDFRPRLHAVLDAVAAHVGPVIEQRLGLRYVDRITHPSVKSPQDWQGLVISELLGLVAHPNFGPVITTAFQQLDLVLGDGVGTTLRQGPVSPQSGGDAASYILDIDVFRDQSRGLDLEGIKAAADHFNTVALQIFQQAITPTLLATFREEDKPNGANEGNAPLGAAGPHGG